MQPAVLIKKRGLKFRWNLNFHITKCFPRGCCSFPTVSGGSSPTRISGESETVGKMSVSAMMGECLQSHTYAYSLLKECGTLFRESTYSALSCSRNENLGGKDMPFPQKMYLSHSGLPSMAGTLSEFQFPVLQNLEQHSIGMPLSTTNSKPPLSVQLFSWLH